jgi:hypothetical protein
VTLVASLSFDVCSPSVLLLFFSDVFSTQGCVVDRAPWLAAQNARTGSFVGRWKTAEETAWFLVSTPFNLFCYFQCGHPLGGCKVAFLFFVEIVEVATSEADKQVWSTPYYHA